MRYLKNFENHNLSDEDLEYIRRREQEDEEDEFFNRYEDEDEEVQPEFDSEFETDTDELPF